MVGRILEELCQWAEKKTWIKWLHLGEFGYNTNFYMSIGMSPFKEIYVYDPYNFIDQIFCYSIAPNSNYWMEESQKI